MNEKEKKPAGTSVSLRLQPAKLAALDAMAHEAGMSRTSLIQLAIDRLLKRGL